MPAGTPYASLDRVLRLNPNSRSALQLAAATAVRRKQLPRAYALSTRGRALFPDDLVFRYLESASAESGGTTAVIALARSSPAALAELAAVAQLIGDRAMLLACREALAARTRAPAAPLQDDY